MQKALKNAKYLISSDGKTSKSKGSFIDWAHTEQCVTHCSIELRTWMRKPYLRLSIFTATVVTVSAEQSPYAVALTTFPNAPEPRVFPAGKHMKT